MSVETQDFVTRNELDIRLNGVDEQAKANAQKIDLCISSMEKLFDEKIDKMQAIMEKNLAEFKAVASEMKADFNDLRGNVKAIEAKVDSLQMKFGWYLMLFGVGVSALIFLAQKFFG